MSADRKSSWCGEQPESPTECELNLRWTLLALEAFNDLFLSQIEAENGNSLSQANSALDLSQSAASGNGSGGQGVSLCGAAIDTALLNLTSALQIAQENTVSTQQSMNVILQGVAAQATSREVASPALRGAPGTLESDRATRVAVARAVADSNNAVYNLPPGAFGDFMAWATTLLVDYLREEERALMAYAAGIAEIAGRGGGGEAAAAFAGSGAGVALESPPGTGGAVVDSNDAVGRQIARLNALTVREALVQNVGTALSHAWQNAVTNRQRTHVLMLATVSRVGTVILREGDGLDVDVLATASEGDRTPFLGVTVTPVEVPELSLLSGVATDFVNEFLDLLQANHLAFNTSMSMLDDQSASYFGRLVDLARAADLASGSAGGAAVKEGVPAVASSGGRADNPDQPLLAGSKNLTTLADVSGQKAVSEQQEWNTVSPDQLLLLVLQNLVTSTNSSMQSAVNAQQNWNTLLLAVTTSTIAALLNDNQE